MIDDILNSLNADRFLKEFSFAKNEFKPKPGEELEFADHVIHIGDLLIIFQQKKREISENQTFETEKKWFRNKVLNKARKQIKDTLKYFDNNKHIEIENQKGYRIDL
jgi:hypothetical protein